MTVNNVSSAYLATALLPAVHQAQAQLSTLEVESSTGQYQNLGLQLGSQSGYELSLRAQDDLLQAMSVSNGVVATTISTAQSALTQLSTAATTAAATLVNNSSANASALQSIGQSNLQQLVQLGNTTSAGAYVFAGDNTGVAPLDDYFASPSSSAKASVDAAFQNYFGFATTSSQTSDITASQLQSFLTGPYASLFASPYWGADWSNASSQNTSAQIAPGTTVTTSTNTNTQGFQQLAEGYTMLSEFGNIGLSADAQQTLATTAASVIHQGASGITSAQAQLGDAQSQITDANTAIGNQTTLLQTELGRLDSVDPAQIATELSTLSTQLQTAYQLTAKINDLNLAQYLPA